jgi:urease gamma subunit
MDGLVEVPVATIVQNLKTPWGKRRPAILVGTIVMTLAYVLFCFPISYEENSVANSIYLGILLTVFVSFFTLAINALFGTYAEITANDNDRLLLTNVKAAFDTIQCSIAYALIPVFIGFGINIRNIGLYFAPLVLTMGIALLLIKEDSTMPGAVVKYGENAGKTVEEVMNMARKVLTRADVMEGVPEMIPFVQLEAVFTDGSRLVTVHSPIN